MLALLMAAAAELATVPYVDLERYQGKWYEVARFPHRFQSDCAGSTAEYALRADGTVSVRNTCYREDGEVRTVEGTARAVDETNARLSVRFEGLFFKLFSWFIKPNYWIVELDPDYRYAVVGAPNRKYLWILSREPQMEESLYRELLERIEKHGFAIEKIRRTRVRE
jgi:apolipoprotein D and lipocalin family protein